MAPASSPENAIQMIHKYEHSRVAEQPDASMKEAGLNRCIPIVPSCEPTNSVPIATPEGHDPCSASDPEGSPHLGLITILHRHSVMRPCAAIVVPPGARLVRRHPRIDDQPPTVQ